MKRITRRDLRGLYEPAPRSLYDDIHEALAALPEGKEQRKVKKKLHVGFILAAALLALSAAGFAATRLELFSKMTRYAEPIVPLNGAEALVETGLGSAENDWVTVTVEEAAFDGQGVMVLARVTPKDPEQYALYNSWLMNATEDLYDVETVPAPVPEGEQEVAWDPTIRVVNNRDEKRLYRDDREVVIPESREAAEAAGLPVYISDDVLYYADQWDRRVTGGRDGRPLIGFDVSLEAGPGDPALDELLYHISADAEAQLDGSVLVWFDTFADEPLPETIELKLTARTWPNGEDDRQGELLNEIVFTLERSEAERVARYVPEGDGQIGDHVRVRELSIRFTPVRGYMTVDYEYQPQPEEDMGIWLHPCDADGDPITTGSGSGDDPEVEAEQGFCRQMQEMQSFDEVPDVIVLEAKVIGGETLGQCVFRLAETE